MAFSPLDQARLGEIYAPTLLLSSNDIAPISPAEYIRRSALWSYPGPVDGPFGTEADNQSWVAPAPELMPGMLAASEDDPDIDDRTLLWAHLSDNPNLQFFLDHGGWDNQERTDVDSLPEPGNVTETSQNLMGSIGETIARWDPRQDDSPLGQHIGWYYVQAFDTVEDSQQLRSKLAAQQDAASEQVESIISSLPRLAWLVFYHFFFPACWKRVSACELQRQLWSIGVLGNDFLTTEGDFPEIPTQFVLGYPYSFEWAGNLGAFATLAVVAPAPPPLPDPAGNLKFPRPQDLDDDEFEPPLYVGFGRSIAGVEDTPTGPPVDVSAMHVAAADEVQLDGNHPRVFVSEGNHNLYPEPGEFPGPSSEELVSICHWADGPREITESPVGPVPSPYTSTFSLSLLAKFLTMGFFGALASSVLERPGRELVEGGPSTTIPDGSRPDDVEQDPEGLVLAPEELVDAFADQAGLVRPWAGAAQERVFDERWDNPWLLSWGPPAMQDPFRLRQGRPMRRFIGPFISELGARLEVDG